MIEFDLGQQVAYEKCLHTIGLLKNNLPLHPDVLMRLEKVIELELYKLQKSRLE